MLLNFFEFINENFYEIDNLSYNENGDISGSFNIIKNFVAELEKARRSYDVVEVIEMYNKYIDDEEKNIYILNYIENNCRLFLQGLIDNFSSQKFLEIYEVMPYRLEIEYHDIKDYQIYKKYDIDFLYPQIKIKKNYNFIIKHASLNCKYKIDSNLKNEIKSFEEFNIGYIMSDEQTQLIDKINKGILISYNKIKSYNKNFIHGIFNKDIINDYKNKKNISKHIINFHETKKYLNFDILENILNILNNKNIIDMPNLNFVNYFEFVQKDYNNNKTYYKNALCNIFINFNKNLNLFKYNDKFISFAKNMYNFFLNLENNNIHKYNIHILCNIKIENNIIYSNILKNDIEQNIDELIYNIENLFFYAPMIECINEIVLQRFKEIEKIEPNFRELFKHSNFIKNPNVIYNNFNLKNKYK